MHRNPNNEEYIHDNYRDQLGLKIENDIFNFLEK
jgi:hypothetical protein